MMKFFVVLFMFVVVWFFVFVVEFIGKVCVGNSVEFGGFVIEVFVF